MQRPRRRSRWLAVLHTLGCQLEWVASLQGLEKPGVEAREAWLALRCG